MDGKRLAIATRGIEVDSVWFDECGQFPLATWSVGLDYAAPGSDKTVYGMRLMQREAGFRVERFRSLLDAMNELMMAVKVFEYVVRHTPEHRAMVDEELRKRLNAAADAGYVAPSPEERAHRVLKEAFEALRAQPRWIGVDLASGPSDQTGYWCP